MKRMALVLNADTERYAYGTDDIVATAQGTLMMTTADGKILEYNLERYVRSRMTRAREPCSRCLGQGHMPAARPEIHRSNTPL